MTKKALESTERSEPAPTCPVCSRPLPDHNWTEAAQCQAWLQVYRPSRRGYITSIS